MTRVIFRVKSPFHLNTDFSPITGQKVDFKEGDLITATNYYGTRGGVKIFLPVVTTRGKDYGSLPMISLKMPQ